MIALLALFATVARADAPPAGQRLAEEAGCAVCHAVPGVARPDRTASCDGCHAWVKKVAANPAAREKAMALFPRWTRYEQNVATYFAVPDLGAAFARLDPAWVRGYLADPYDVRPHMPETMVRVGLGAPELDAIASWAATFRPAVPATPPPSPARIARGERLFAELGCGACHGFGALAAGADPAAPDLRHARDRMDDDVIVAWIRDPAAVGGPGARMPSLGVAEKDAIALRDFLVLADPGGVAPAPPAAALPRVDRPVSFVEVEERVVGKICVHCHMDPAQNEGRAGPGNAGAFGWAATGLELQTYESVKAHGAQIVAALLRRRDEAARDCVAAGEVPAAVARPALPGMPLGLPPIPDEDIALVAAWVAQGAPP